MSTYTYMIKNPITGLHLVRTWEAENEKEFVISILKDNSIGPELWNCIKVTHRDEINIPFMIRVERYSCLMVAQLRLFADFLSRRIEVLAREEYDIYVNL